MNTFQQTQKNTIESVSNIVEDDRTYYYRIGLHYQLVESYVRMERNFLEAINRGCVNSMYELGIYYLMKYYENGESNELMEKYFLMAIENGCVNSMYELGSYYNSIADYDKMNFYYAMINDGNYSVLATKFPNIAFNLGRYYQTVENNSLMLEYYELCYKHDDDRPKGYLLNYYANNILEYYGWLHSLEDNELISNIKRELSADHEVSIYLEKMNKHKTNIKNCVICFESKQHIDIYYCPLGHEVCVSCYCKIDTCYYRCGRR